MLLTGYFKYVTFCEKKTAAIYFASVFCVFRDANRKLENYSTTTVIVVEISAYILTLT